MKQVYLKTRREWRNWLKENHEKSDGIWLVFYKKHTGKPSLDYEDAVQECLCFGWIDSIIKKIDDERYVRKMTPRKPNSQWSESNRARITVLRNQGLMTRAGISKVKEAEKNGRWDESEIPPEIPAELLNELAKNRIAETFFNQLAPSYRKQFIGWIASAKRKETIERRVMEAIALLEQGKKLGME